MSIYCWPATTKLHPIMPTLPIKVCFPLPSGSARFSAQCLHHWAVKASRILQLGPPCMRVIREYFGAKIALLLKYF